jgi:hypothetical protein
VGWEGRKKGERRLSTRGREISIYTYICIYIYIYIEREGPGQKRRHGGKGGLTNGVPLEKGLSGVPAQPSMMYHTRQDDSTHFFATRCTGGSAVVP